MAKIIKVDDCPEKIFSFGRGRWIDENVGLSKFGLVVAEIEPDLPNPRYHYHENREHVHIILEGRAKFTVEGEEHVICANSIILIPAGARAHLDLEWLKYNIRWN
jgi:mannose-6-phosphate isomerase-like protein (cupin superfamily)